MGSVEVLQAESKFSQYEKNLLKYFIYNLFSRIIVAGDFKVVDIAQKFIDKLQLGGLFVAFSSSVELLSETFEFMNKS